MNIFQTAIMTLQHSDGTIVAQHLPCQLDTVNQPWNLEGQGMIPTDWYDLFSIGWITPVPLRSDYFIDEVTRVKYSAFGEVGIYVDHLEIRVTKYSGGTP